MRVFFLKNQKKHPIGPLNMIKSVKEIDNMGKSSWISVSVTS